MNSPSTVISPDYRIRRVICRVSLLSRASSGRTVKPIITARAKERNEEIKSNHIKVWAEPISPILFLGKRDADRQRDG